MRIEQFLERSARRTPEKTALVHRGRRLTYGEIDRLSNGLADALLAGGLRRGDRVVVLLENSVEAVVSIFGILKAGGVFVLLNATTKPGKLAYVLNNCRAAALIGHAKLRQALPDLEAQVPALRWVLLPGGETAPAADRRLTQVGWDRVAPREGGPGPDPGIDIDLATIIYTSGSTGYPKGVMMTHLNMAAAATSITTYLANTADDVILSALPLSFDYGLYQVLMAFLVGATVVLEVSFTYPQEILRQLQVERVTGFPIVPTMAALLLQAKTPAPLQLPHLRYLTNTAAALPPAHAAQLGRLFPSARLFSMYGLTECKRVSYLPPELLERKPTSVGKAIPNTEAYVVNERGERAAPGEVGELVVRGAHVMRGYWEMPEETGRVLREGPVPGEKLLYTGDLFRADEEGDLYFVGRKDDIIKTRGEKVSPAEVENALYGIKEVLEAAVVGVPDDVLGQAVKAFVVLREGSQLTSNEILSHCKRNLEDFMVPRQVEIRSSLPKTETEKIHKGLLPLELGVGPGRGMHAHTDNGLSADGTVHGRVARAMERWPDRVAVVHRKRAWSYAELADLAEAYRRRLEDGGFVRGDRAVLWMENSAEYVAAYLAVLNLGGVVVALHAQTMPEEAVRTARQVDASALVTSSPVWRRAGKELADSGLRFVLTGRETHRLAGGPPVEPAPEGLAQIIFTSGSTGRPKGVMLSHGNLLANADAIIEYLGLRETDSVMAVLPFVYAYGNSVMLTHLLTGGKLVIENSFVYPKIVLDSMAGESVTGFCGVASTYALLLTFSALGGYAFPALRYLTHAGGPLPLELLDRLRGAFDDKDIFVMYGQTEASARLTYLPPEMIDRKRGSAGRAIPGVTLGIVAPDGEPLPAGATGEVAASGANVMMGYWRNPELTRTVLRDGWLRTGDIGRLDEDGFLYIVGRNSEIIKSGAFRISPYEIEEVLLRHPDVFEAGVVGMEDPILGETIYGVVAPREGRRPEEQELLAFCARHLAPYKRPKAIVRVTALPKSPSGKILRQAIKDDLDGRLRQTPTQVNS